MKKLIFVAGIDEWNNQALLTEDKGELTNNQLDIKVIQVIILYQ